MRIRRLQGEDSGLDVKSQSDHFLNSCLREGLKPDHIVVLARQHKPTLELFGGEFGNRFESKIDAAIARQLALLDDVSEDFGFIDWHLVPAEPPPVQWCLPGWIAQGDSVSLVGLAKSGKSLLTLRAAAAMATGTSFLDRDVTRAPVLYLDYENKPAVIQQRLREMGFDFCDPADSLYYENFPRTGPLDGQRGAEAVLARVKATGAKLVVIDTLQRVLTGDENNSQGIRDLYRNLLMPLAAMGVAVLRLDHLGKSGSGSARGSSAKGDDVDQSWVLKVRDDGLLSLRQVLSRSPSGQECFILERKSQHLRHVEVVGVAPDDAEADEDGVSELVAELDSRGLPDRAGRPAAIKMLKAAGRGYSTEVLVQALKHRQRRAT